MITRLVLKLAVVLALAVLCPKPGLAWLADGLDANAAAASEHEALITALDEFGLDLDSPELEGMDGGDIWSYIENRRHEKTEAEQDSDGAVSEREGRQ